MNEPNTIENILRALRVPRIEDLPYWTSPPLQFVYESTATVSAGAFLWNDPASTLKPPRPILQNAVYYFRSISLSADIAELDFEVNLVRVPTFYMYRNSDANAVLFREPVMMNKYYDQFDFRLLWASAKMDDSLNGAFAGPPPGPSVIDGVTTPTGPYLPASILQGPNLAGKTTITLKAVVSAQEIIDDQFIELVRHYSYPKVNA